jgi:geranylgeranyl diphosphate synthase type II
MAATATDAATALLDSVETALSETLLLHRDAPPRLIEACRHAVLGGGKRLRPLLCLRCCEAVGGRGADALPAACAVELVHCFSLVHDDLPALDDDDLRRGRPTVHRAFDEATAILAGDYLMGLAFETLLGHARHGARLAAELATATNRMIVGQVWDTLGETREGLPAAAQLRRIHRDKTGALILGACRLGAICGGADEEALAAITTFGDAAGEMFQAVDDLLDETQSTEHLGKASGKDREAGKLTHPAVHGLDGTRAAIEALRVRAIEALRPFEGAGEPLAALAEQLAARTR